MDKSSPESSPVTVAVGAVTFLSTGGGVVLSSLNSLYPAGIGYIGLPFTKGINNSSPLSLTYFLVSVFCSCPKSVPIKFLKGIGS